MGFLMPKLDWPCESFNLNINTEGNTEMQKESANKRSEYGGITELAK